MLASHISWFHLTRAWYVLAARASGALCCEKSTEYTLHVCESVV